MKEVSNGAQLEPFFVGELFELYNGWEGGRRFLSGEAFAQPSPYSLLLLLVAFLSFLCLFISLLILVFSILKNIIINRTRQSELVPVYMVDAAFGEVMGTAESQLKAWRHTVGSGKIVSTFGARVRDRSLFPSFPLLS